MSHLNPTTLKHACSVVAPKLGKQLPLARKEVVTAVNRIRQRIFKELQPASAFSDLHYCIRPSSFGDQGSCYTGFTLPREAGSLTAVWQHHGSIRVVSEWREAYLGPVPDRDHGIAVVSSGTSPVERALRKTSNLRIFSETDCKGVVVIRGFDERGARTSVELSLRKNEWTVSPQLFSRIESVVLPDTLVGRVILADNEGYELSHYYPGELVPSYARYKLNATYGAVLVATTRQFVEIGCDTQIVEVGDRDILENGAVWIRYENSKDSAELRTASVAERRMLDSLAKLLTALRGVERRGPVITPRKKTRLYSLKRR